MKQDLNMPPKKAPAKGGGKKAKAGAGAGEASKAAAAPDDPLEAERARQLREEAMALHRLVETEVQGTAGLKKEVERLGEAWERDSNALHDKREERNVTVKACRDMQAAQKEELEACQRRLRGLILEHHEEIMQRKTDAEASLQAAQEAHRAGHEAGRLQHREGQMQLKARELQQLALAREAERAFGQQISSLRQEYEQKVLEVQKDHEARMAAMREEGRRCREADVAEVEAKKAARVAGVKEAHAAALAETKAHYNGLIGQNLGVLYALRAEAQELRKRAMQNDKRLAAVRQDHEALAQPMAKATHAVAGLEAAVQALEADTRQLAAWEAKVKQRDRAARALGRTEEGLKQRLAKVQEEVDDLRARMQAVVLKAQQATSFKAMLLENKLRREQTQVEHRIQEAEAAAAAAEAAQAWRGASVVVLGQGAV